MCFPKMDEDNDEFTSRSTYYYQRKRRETFRDFVVKANRSKSILGPPSSDKVIHLPVDASGESQSTDGDLTETSDSIQVTNDITSGGPADDVFHDENEAALSEDMEEDSAAELNSVGPNSEISNFSDRDLSDDSESHCDWERNEEVLCENIPKEMKFTSSLLQLQIRHNMTDLCVNEVAKLLNEAAGEIIVPTSSYKIQNYFSKIKSTVETHHICPRCSQYIGIIVSKSLRCSHCETSVDAKANHKNGNTFLYISVSSQIKGLLENSRVLSQMNFKSHQGGCMISDLCTGSKYTILIKDVSDCDYVFTLSFGCDGVPVFKSSNSAIWPLLFQINELPPRLRRVHVMMASLWYSNNGGKPNMQTYLRPFVNEMKNLSKNGFTCNVSSRESVKIKVKVALNISDSVARPMQQLSTQFNGGNGCSFCEHKGVRLPKGRGYARFYPHVEGVVQRTHEDTLRYGTEAEITQKSVCGIKGVSILSEIPGFDLVDGFTPDYMHSAILGVTRAFLNLWLDPQSNCYIGPSNVEAMDVKLLRIKPTAEFSRTPRSVKHRKFWKAHEYYAWLFFYSLIVMKGVLREKYHRHWALFVEGMYILLKEEVRKSEVYTAHNLLVTFVKETETLYGVDHCSFNVHLCEHLAFSGLMWGLLWSHSAFAFESYNNVLMKGVRSSKGVLKQVTNSFVSRRVMPGINKYCTTNLSNDLLWCSRNKPKRTISLSKDLFCVGNIRMQTPEVNHRLALASVAVTVQANSFYKHADRLEKKGELFASCRYKADLKRNNYTVVLKDSQFFSVDTYILIEQENERSKCFALGYFLEVNRSYKLVKDNVAGFITPLKKSSLNICCAVNVSKFKHKIVYVDCWARQMGTAFAVPLPNRLEALK